MEEEARNVLLLLPPPDHTGMAIPCPQIPGKDCPYYTQACQADPLYSRGDPCGRP